MNERERYELATRIFLEASALPSGEVAALLADRCGDDAELLALVTGLLAARQEGNLFSGLARELQPMHDMLRDQASGATTLGREAAGTAPRAYNEEQAGDLIGRFHLLELIGEGGFGRVWVAEQREPVLRRVALKVIKAGMDSKQVVARFEQERQALAMMDHPHIAKVFDAGTTGTGRPFFVMELCKGSAISTYCDEHRLPIADRLDLFRQVCTAVQHAHTKGVIHRDIKPNNVLVTTSDGRPHAKVIDFGIAKAIETRLTEKTFFTEHRQLIGTPEYMSPEQAEGSLDIDTRTDVYSLGVLLYELLTGSTPFSSRELRSAAFGEMQRIIREVDPPRPSTRIQQSSGTRATVATHRRTEPHKLDTTIRGELDWIVMKSLEKDRARRYESAGGLAADIERFLAGHAVVAAPPSRAYLLRKFIRRNRAGAAAVSGIALALLIGAAAFAWQARVARIERDRAVAAEREASKRANELEQVSSFQAGMFEQFDPARLGQRLTDQVRKQFKTALSSSNIPLDQQKTDDETFANLWSRINPTDTAVDVIDYSILQPAVKEVARRFADQPLIDAKLRQVLAKSYLEIGRYDTGAALFEQAEETFRKNLGDDNPATIETLSYLGRARNFQDKTDDAITTLTTALERQRRVLGNENEATLLTVNMLAGALIQGNDPARALPYCKGAVQISRNLHGENSFEAFQAKAALANALRLTGDHTNARQPMQEAVAGMILTRGVKNNDTLTALCNLGLLYYANAEWTEAGNCFEQALSAQREMLGAAHPDTLQTTNSLSSVYFKLGRADEAEKMLRDSLASLRLILGSDHDRTLTAMSNLGTMLTSRGKLEEAESLCRECLERRIRTCGRHHRLTLISYNVMGFVLRRQKRDQEAEPFLREALEISEDVLGADHPDRLIFILNFGSLLQSLNQLDEAESILRDGLERCTRTLPPIHPTTRAAFTRLSDLLIKARRFEAALNVLQQGEKGAREAYASAEPAQLAAYLKNIAHCRFELKQFPELEGVMLEVRSIYADSVGESDSATTGSIQALIRFYEAWEAADPGKGHGDKATEWRSRLDSIPATTTRPVIP